MSDTTTPEGLFEKPQRKRKRSVPNTDEITRLRAENASLAAWQCVYTDGKTGLVGDEHGNQYCAMAKRVDALRSENERLRAALEQIAGYRMKGKSDAEIARAALGDTHE